MKFITGKDRNQTEFFCLDQAVSEDNEVRLIDLFVGAIKLSEYGFKVEFIENGRRADVGLIFTSYNLRRIFNLIGQNELKMYLKGLVSLFLIVIGHFKLQRRTFAIGIF
jgi:hypothetical protein